MCVHLVEAIEGAGTMRNGASGADMGGGGMTGNTLRLVFQEWEGVLNTVDRGGWMSGGGIESAIPSFSASVTLSVILAKTWISIYSHLGEMENLMRTPTEMQVVELVARSK